MHVVVEEEYTQKASAISSLRAILEGYPLSAGIFRELVQNSDDAGASKQVRLTNPQPVRLSYFVDICFRPTKPCDWRLVQGGIG